MRLKGAAARRRTRFEKDARDADRAFQSRDPGSRGSSRRMREFIHECWLMFCVRRPFEFRGKPLRYYGGES